MIMMADQLKQDYVRYRKEIRKRLTDFARVWDEGDEAIFKELCFCILAANSSADMGMRTLSAIEDLLWEGDLPSIQRRLSRGFRYWRVRPAYIVSTREYLREICGLKLKTLIQSFPDPQARRDFFAANPRIRGIGYKEASHFLRNIGFRGYAILDKHILTCLRELKVIGPRLVPLPARRYRLIEKRMKRFAQEISIDMDELDLLLWRHKTGKILK
jgi:N-glycosylase/DNA lyase